MRLIIFERYIREFSMAVCVYSHILLNRVCTLIIFFNRSFKSRRCIPSVSKFKIRTLNILIHARRLVDILNFEFDENGFKIWFVSVFKTEIYIKWKKIKNTVKEV